MRAKPIPGLQYAGRQKLGAPARPQTSASEPIIALPEPSWGHGVDTQRYTTEGELTGPRY